MKRRHLLLGLLGATFAVASQPLWAVPQGDSGWAAAVDVAPGTLATQPATTSPAAAALFADPYRMKNNFNSQPVFSGTREVLAPSRPSKYMLTLAPFSMGYELWNLQTGAKEKESAVRLDFDPLALSPDGQFLAGYQRGARGAVGAVTILSLRTGKIVGTIAAPAGAVIAPEIAGFGGNDLILIAFRTGLETNLIIHDIAGPNTAGQVAIPGNAGLKSCALSPSGQYLAIAQGGMLSFYETKSGRLLGPASYKPAKEDDPFSADRVNWDFADSRVAFSANGQEIAVVQADRNKLHATILSATTGKTIEDHVTSAAGAALDRRATIGTAPEALTWNPDGSSLLWGMAVIDRATLAAVYQLPKRDSVLYTRWADPTNVFVVSKGTAAEPARGATPGRSARGAAGERLVFETLPVSKEQIAKAAGAVESGGKIEDAALTPLTPVTDAAKVLSLDTATATPWNVKIDDPKPAKSIAASFPIKPPGNDDPSNDSPAAILFTGREAHAAFIEHFAESKDFAAHGQRAKTWLDRHDLATGGTITSLELPASFRALDVSETGKTLAFRSGNEGDRIDIYTQDKATYKPLAAFRPFGVAKPAFSAISGNDDPNIVEWAAFPDDAHVLIKGQGGILELLELPSGHALWKASIPPTTHFDHLVPALSPDRRLAAVSMKDSIFLFNPLTGESLNRLPASTEEHMPRAVAFSPEGSRLAALISYTGQDFLDVYDLKSGQTAIHFPISVGATPRRLFFLSPAYVLLDCHPFPGQVISLDKKSIVWQYTMPALQFGPVMPYDEFFLSAAADLRGPASLISATLPQGEATRAAAALSESDLYIWHPGMTVKLDISVVGDDAYRAQQIALWTAALKTRGITMDEKSPNTLRANSFPMDTPPATYNIFNGQKITASQKLTGYTVTLNLGDKEIWKAEYNKVPEHYVPQMMVTVQPKPGETAQQAYDREVASKPQTASAIVPPPMYVFKERTIPTSPLSARPTDPVNPHGPADRGPRGTPPARGPIRGGTP